MADSRGSFLDDGMKDIIATMMPLLDEQQRRILLSVVAENLGWGSAGEIAEFTGYNIQTLTRGRKEVMALPRSPRARPGSGTERRVRAEGGGRKSALEKNPGLRQAVLDVIDCSTAGDPMRPLLWTIKSTRTISAELKAMGYDVSHVTVGSILGEMGFSLQQNRKYTECGDPGPDRDAQFRFISSEARRFIDEGAPVISVDAKKKENVGDFKNGGAEYRPKGCPREVLDHDFCTRHAVPYGVYDVANNEGYVNIGVSADTAEFAVESIGQWWHVMGRKRFPDARDVMVTCDGGGSNGSRVRLWKYKLQEMADFTGLTFHVRHYPPGTSKWNKIEHRMFSFISMNWRGRPLESYETIVNLIGATTNSSGLRIECSLDDWEYERGKVVTDEEMESLNLIRDDWRGDWNYTIAPRNN